MKKVRLHIDEITLPAELAGNGRMTSELRAHLVQMLKAQSHLVGAQHHENLHLEVSDREVRKPSTTAHAIATRIRDAVQRGPR